MTLLIWHRRSTNTTGSLLWLHTYWSWPSNTIIKMGYYGSKPLKFFFFFFFWFFLFFGQHSNTFAYLYWRFHLHFPNYLLLSFSISSPLPSDSPIHFSLMEAKGYTQDGTVDLQGRPVIASKTGKWRACAFLVGNHLFLLRLLFSVFLHFPEEWPTFSKFSI